MAKALYDEVSGVARKVKKKYDGVSGIARKVKKAYDGVNGIARQYFGGGTPLGELPIGTTVKAYYDDPSSLSRKGTVEFIVVHHGRPSTHYTGFDGGTCLWVKYVLPCLKNEYIVYGQNNYDIWDAEAEDYWQVYTSDYGCYGMHARLNNYFVNYFNIASLMNTVKVPYAAPDCDQYEDEYGWQYVINRYQGYVSCKLFVLSLAEMGCISDYYDGVKLDYFKQSGSSSSNTEANNLRKFQESSGSSTYHEYWTRTVSGDNYAFPIGTNGYYGSVRMAGSATLIPRFACVLPSTTLVDDSFNIIV